MSPLIFVLCWALMGNDVAIVAKTLLAGVVEPTSMTS
jgi:hypothetical protein